LIFYWRFQILSTKFVVRGRTAVELRRWYSLMEAVETLTQNYNPKTADIYVP
jgi:hypothetical protein